MGSHSCRHTSWKGQPRISPTCTQLLIVDPQKAQVVSGTADKPVGATAELWVGTPGTQPRNASRAAPGIEGLVWFTQSPLLAYQGNKRADDGPRLGPVSPQLVDTALIPRHPVAMRGLPLSAGTDPLPQCSLPGMGSTPKGPGTCFSGEKERRGGALEEKPRSKIKWDPTAVHGTRVVTGGLLGPLESKELQIPSEPHRNAEWDTQEPWGTAEALRAGAAAQEQHRLQGALSSRQGTSFFSR